MKKLSWHMRLLLRTTLILSGIMLIIAINYMLGINVSYPNNFNPATEFIRVVISGFGVVVISVALGDDLNEI